MNAKPYTVEDLFHSINDIYFQLDEGKMPQNQAIILVKRCCSQFLSDHQNWTEKNGIPMYVPPKEVKNELSN